MRPAWWKISIIVGLVVFGAFDIVLLCIWANKYSQEEEEVSYSTTNSPQHISISQHIEWVPSVSNPENTNLKFGDWRRVGRDRLVGKVWYPTPPGVKLIDQVVVGQFDIFRAHVYLKDGTRAGNGLVKFPRIRTYEVGKAEIILWCDTDTVDRIDIVRNIDG